jgi:hypothetical protein
MQQPTMRQPKHATLQTRSSHGPGGIMHIMPDEEDVTLELDVTDELLVALEDDADVEVLEDDVVPVPPAPPPPMACVPP